MQIDGHRMLVGLCAVLALAANANAAERPDIVIVLADDLGWRDVGYHQSEIATPHIDALSRENVELDRFYVQPTCSPTRASLMTGHSPTRYGITRPLGKNEPEGLALDARILPQYFAALGYQPLMVGKWHLGNHRPAQFPQARGFEYFYGYLSGGVGYWDHNHGGGHDWQRNGTTLREEGYATHLLTDDAVRQIRGRDPTRPLLLYVAFGAPHLPNEAPGETVARYASIPVEKRRVHAAMVSELDAAIGRIRAALDEEGMTENTIFFFSSDNGGLSPDATPAPVVTAANALTSLFDRPIPWAPLEFFVSNVEDAASDNAPLPGGKMSIAEGGARVPAAIAWPGKLEARRHEGFTTIADVLPTLLHAVAGPGAVPPGLDGRSRWDDLRGAEASATADHLTVGIDGEALYRAPWKLVRSDPPRLFDVYADPLEEQDLADANPELVAELEAAAEAWPRGERDAMPLWRAALDPDSFGGIEDRAPWADAARERGDLAP